MEKSQIIQLINNISGKNQVARGLLTQVSRLAPNYATVVAMTLQKYNVTGDNIEKMYVDCCEKDIGTFLMAVNRMLEGKYTKFKIYKKIQKGEPFEI